MKRWFSCICVSIALLNTVFLSAEYEAKDFSHLIGKVAGLNDDLLKMHFKLYQGYVSNTNTILKKLQEMDEKKQNHTPEYAGLKRILGWEFDGMLLHEYYFDNLGGNGEQSLAKDDPLRKCT